LTCWIDVGWLNRFTSVVESRETSFRCKLFCGIIAHLWHRTAQFMKQQEAWLTMTESLVERKSYISHQTANEYSARQYPIANSNCKSSPTEITLESHGSRVL